MFKQCVQNKFFHEWAPYGRWGGDRTVKSHIVALRGAVLRLNYHVLQKIGFTAPRHFMIVFVRNNMIFQKM